jgi:hypothetical protein
MARRNSASSVGNGGARRPPLPPAAAAPAGAGAGDDDDAETDAILRQLRGSASAAAFAQIRAAMNPHMLDD